MKKNSVITGFITLLFSSCISNPYQNDLTETVELVSSKGEKIYICSTIWGVTGDYQLSTVTKNKDKFNDIRDTTGSVKGLNPFEYKFKNDTLTLYFRSEISYHIAESFYTVIIQYKIMDADYYKGRDTSFHSVPDLEPHATSNIPKPPAE
jgi:hypothetical protein